MIRVLHVLGGLDRGGAESMVMQLYRNIDRSTIQFDFIVHTPQKQAYYQEVLSLGGKIYHFPAFNGKNFFAMRKLWKRFFEQHPEYTIVHSHVRSYASVYMPIAKKCGRKTIIHSHSTSNGKSVISAVKYLLQYPLRFQADYLFACSTESGKWLYGSRALKKNNYVFLPNGIDIERYRYSKETANEYRAKLNLQNNFVIGHVGRFHEAKNHMFLLDIMAEVCHKRSDAMLLLVGDGPQREKIEEKIRKMDLEQRVILTGSRSDVPELMQAMDVFVFPSLWEGLPVTVVEAQASGLPCLVSDKITKDIDISDLVNRLSINSVSAWSDMLVKMDVARMDVQEQIRAAGFSVQDLAWFLRDFYIELERGNEKESVSK